MTKSKKIIIYGTGGLGRGIMDLIGSINKHTDSCWNVVGFVDDEINNAVNGLSILGGIEYLLDYQEEINVILAFGIPKVKQKVFNIISENKNIKYPNLIHPSVEISRFNRLGKGNILSKGVSLSTNIKIGDFNLIHYNCSVGHDVLMGNYNSVFPLTALSGYSKIGNSVEFGTNSSVIPNISIEDHAVVGAGSTIIKDVKEYSTVVGVPGKEL